VQFPRPAHPAGLDWDAWCGPNEVVPYHTDLYLSRIPYEREEPYYTPSAERYAVGPGWMSFRPYSGGELLNWGCHGLSMVHWALDMDHSGPVEVWVEPEEKLPLVVYDLPDTRDRGDAACSHPIIHYRYANGVVLSLTSIDPKLGGGATFIGDKGRITIFRDGYECDPVGLDEDPLPADAVASTRATTTWRTSSIAWSRAKTRSCRSRPGTAWPPVPPGQHRPLAGPPPGMGPGEGDLPRRRRGQPVPGRAEAQTLRTADRSLESTTMTWRPLAAAVLAAFHALGLALAPC
jgi:hypothetical protein